jgi:hypothetical protein
VKAFIAGVMRESAAGSAAASRIGSTKRFMGPHIYNVAIVAILSRALGQPPRFFRPVPGLRRDRLSPSADALGYYLSPCGLGRMKFVAAREETNTW